MREAPLDSPPDRTYALCVRRSVGLLVAVVATGVNFVTARTLMTVGRASRSITLEADAHHLLTDVWTSIGVMTGVGLVWLTGWLWLDSTIALLVAANILWTGWQLMPANTRSAGSPLDTSTKSRSRK